MKPVVALSIIFSYLIATNALAYTSPNMGDDEIANEWQQRSEAASKKLSMEGLDECDKAIERAFMHPERLSSRSVRTFKINFEVAGAQMHAAYAFKNNKLEAFQLLDLPAGWVAWQRAENKTLSVFVPATKCVIDICTNNPFGPAMCLREKPE